MASPERSGRASPWRGIFERVRDAAGNGRDEHGILGSINWLRHQMEVRGANPNVVRNIIYRDKGKAEDKRVLYEILGDLWSRTGRGTLHAPEIEALLAPGGGAEQEVLRLLGRDKRRAFRAFVDAVAAGRHPKMLITGRPGSGKAMLSDYIQQALQGSPEPAAVVRAEFGSGDLGTSLTRLGEALGAPRAALEARLAKIGTAGAFAVQADAQADLARTVLDAARDAEGLVVLLHVSRALQGQETLGSVPLRLNTPEVPRVAAPEWLWATLLEPLSKLPGVSLLVSASELPARTRQHGSGFEDPIRLTPPTAAEARRFIKARLPHLQAGQHEAIAQRAGRSFEELRTLTLLAEIRVPRPEPGAETRLADLADLVVGGGDVALREFLAALATVSLPEYPHFEMGALVALRGGDRGGLSELELAFVDPVPGLPDGYRPFSRSLARALRERLERHDPQRSRELHRAAAEHLREAAEADPASEAAARRLHHLHGARDWEAVVAWIACHGIQQSLVGEVWTTAQEELATDRQELFEQVAEHVAAHYVKLGSYRHPDAMHASDILLRSSDARRRAWATLRRAEGSVLRGHHDDAEARLAGWSGSDDPLLEAEAALVRASIARWRGDLARAAAIVDGEARPVVDALRAGGAAERLVRSKVAIWAGLIRKDRGDLEAAVREFEAAVPEDDLLRARLAFHGADVWMALGRLETAAAGFDRAVELSRRSGALVGERARYLARRASLQRRRGRLHDAERDLDAADAILADADGERVEREVWTTRVDEQRALLLLARGRHDESIDLLARSIERVRAYARTYGVDATYTVHRAVLRLGVAYGARALGTAWGLPFPHRPPEPFDRLDLAQARRMLAIVLARLDGPQVIPRADPLGRRALLVSSLLLPPEPAREHAERALALSRFAHPRAEARLHVAAAQLRGHDTAGAREALDTAAGELTIVPGDRGDPGLRAWLFALRLRTHVGTDDLPAALHDLKALLETPLPEAMRAAALRAFGEALEADDRIGWLDHPALPAPLAGGPEAGTLRPGDLLVSRWRRRLDAEIVPPPPVA